MKTLHHIIAVIIVLALAAGARAITLTLAPTAQVRGDNVTLGDIAAIDAPDNIVTQLSAIVVGPSPYAGQSRLLAPGNIRVRLRLNGFNPDTMVIDGAPSVQVSRAVTAVSGASIVESARAWLEQQLAPTATEKTTLTPVRMLNDLSLPEGPLTISCEPAGGNAGNLYHVMTSVVVNGKPAWRGLVSFRLQRFTEVLVSKSAMMRGTALDETMAARAWRDTSSIHGIPLDDAGELNGTRLALSVATGAVLTHAMVETVPVVHRNDTVRVTATCGPLLIATLVTVLEDGAVGAVVKVRNPQTRQDFSARVKSTGELELVY